jgi:hypothetical protein
MKAQRPAPLAAQAIKGGWGMNVQEAVALLRRHNEWRRGNKTENWHDQMPYNPAELGRAIDVVCAHIDREFEPAESIHAAPCWCSECYERFAASKQQEGE